MSVLVSFICFALILAIQAELQCPRCKFVDQSLCKPQCSNLMLNATQIFGIEVCGPGEITVWDNHDSYCAKLVNVGDQCDMGRLSLRKCEQAFSSCQPDSNGINRCTCLDGFKEIDAHCIPEDISCPASLTSGWSIGSNAAPPGSSCSVVLDDCEDLDCAIADSPIPCTPKAGRFVIGSGDTLTERLVDGFSCLPSDFSPLILSTDRNKTTSRRRRRHLSTTTESQSCPSGQFCSIYASYSISECKVRAYGHCCPHSCPVGRPHLLATCEKDAPVKCWEQEGYFCRRSYSNEESVRAFGTDIDRHFLASCCPSHCPQGTVALSDGHCIPKAGIGESCWRDEQCPYTISCVRGICQCYPFQKMVFRAYDYRCITEKFSSLNLGDQCNNGDICGPANSVCNGQKCVCMCGYLKHKNTCIKIDGPCPTDKHTRCRTWKMQGECEANPDWMKPNCPQSCNAC